MAATPVLTLFALLRRPLTCTKRRLLLLIAHDQLRAYNLSPNFERAFDPVIALDDREVRTEITAN